MARYPDRDGFLVRHAVEAKTAYRVLLGILLFTFGSLKFLPTAPARYLAAMQVGAHALPSFLGGWSGLWVSLFEGAPTLAVQGVGSVEILLGVLLILGLARKVVYALGVVFALWLWVGPEMFGLSLGTDTLAVSTGLIYATSFYALGVLDATYGPTFWALDGVLERRWAGWSRVAEMRGFRRPLEPIALSLFQSEVPETPEPRELTPPRSPARRPRRGSPPSPPP